MPPIRLWTRLSLSNQKAFTSTPLRRRTLPFAVIPTCPSPTCACAPTPDLDINHSRPLANSIAPYSQHILLSTGQPDWPSRIEEHDSAWGRFAAELKHALGPKGAGFDPKKTTLINASSFRPSEGDAVSSAATDGSLLLFPSFRSYDGLDFSSPKTLPSLLQAAKTSESSRLPYTSITNPTILICSHNSRDSRCGILGPLLQKEFATQLAKLGLSTGISQFTAEHEKTPVVNVGCLSHIGGHMWAGNVIIYTPPNTQNKLAGTGVWFGRVEPKNVEGIIKETVLGGKIIGELWRGGVAMDGTPIRL